MVATLLDLGLFARHLLDDFLLDIQLIDKILGLNGFSVHRPRHMGHLFGNLSLDPQHLRKHRLIIIHAAIIP